MKRLRESNSFHPIYLDALRIIASYNRGRGIRTVEFSDLLAKSSHYTDALEKAKPTVTQAIENDLERIKKDHGLEAYEVYRPHYEDMIKGFITSHVERTSINKLEEAGLIETVGEMISERFRIKKSLNPENFLKALKAHEN